LGWILGGFDIASLLLFQPRSSEVFFLGRLKGATKTMGFVGRTKSQKGKVKGTGGQTQRGDERMLFRP